jgi:holo-[acyl-carrier protein] synthase
MIVGLGVDLTEVHRVREVIGRHGDRILRRVFTSGEIEYCQRHRNSYERFAARFAAKEAAMKALGIGWRAGIGWKEIEVLKQPSGKPELRFTGKALEKFRELGGSRIHLSLTHTDACAEAQVIIEA